MRQGGSSSSRVQRPRETNNQSQSLPTYFQACFPSFPLFGKAPHALTVNCRSCDGKSESTRGCPPLASWYFCVDRFQTSREARKVGRLANGQFNLGSFALLENRPEWSVDRLSAVMQREKRWSAVQPVKSVCHFTMGPTLTASKNHL